MPPRVDAGRSLSTAAGLAVGIAGAGFVGAGLWGRRETARALARERIVHPGDPAVPVTTAARARSLAELIRQSTIDATGGHPYAEIDAYVDPGGAPTSDSARAAKDELTGQPVENPDHDLWIQSTTLQTALMQAYVAFRLSEAMAALGAALIVAGVGLAAAGRNGA